MQFSLSSVLLLVLISSVACVDRVIQKGLEMGVGPIDEQIWTSGLLEKDLDPVKLYSRGMNYYEDQSTRKFPNSMHAFLGEDEENYARAFMFRKKLTHVSPPWLTLRRHKNVADRKEHGGFYLDGADNINQTWMAAMGLGGGDDEEEFIKYPKIVPHVKMGLELHDVVQMIQNPRDAAIVIFLNCLFHNLDGVVLDVHTQLLMMNAKGEETFWKATNDLVQGLAKLLHNPSKVLSNTPENEKLLSAQRHLAKELIISIPPVVPAGPEYPSMPVFVLKDLIHDVDGMAFNLFDFSAQQPHGPLQPMEWLDMNVNGVFQIEGGLMWADAHKLWVGLQFHGRDFAIDQKTNEVITRGEFMKLIAKYQPPMKWDEKHKEHYCMYKAPGGDKHRIYHPTPRSVQTRLEHFGDKGVGISISDMSHGLDCFYDLL